MKLRREFKIGDRVSVPFGTHSESFHVAKLHRDPDSGYVYGLSDERGIFRYVGGLRFCAPRRRRAPKRKSGPQTGSKEAQAEESKGASGASSLPYKQEAPGSSPGPPTITSFVFSGHTVSQYTEQKRKPSESAARLGRSWAPGELVRVRAPETKRLTYKQLTAEVVA
jgi:hypothetical protein